MTAFVHEGRRSFVVLFAVLAMIVALLAIPATPANAVATAACPATIPSAGFTDLAGLSVDVVDAANCLAFYGITKGTSATTYGPAANVSRWQMALFLTRQAVDHGVTLPSGADQGFTDLTGLSAEAVTAINQLAQLNITKGTSATTFDPNGNVGRWQMALFITRLVTGAGITLPSGADQGFTDISGLAAETQTAINQTAQLAISKGTTATTFDPTGLVTRAQMALFLTRTLQAGGVTPPAATLPVGVPQLVSVAFDAEDTVTEETRLAFTFDEDVAISSAGQFWLIDAFGVPHAAASATLSSSNNKVALAVFSTDEWDNATTAAVTGNGKGGASGAVRDISANYNVNGSVSVASQSVSGLDWPDDYPELVSVAVSAADDDATFTFDQKIDVCDTSANFAGFVLVFKDGTVKPATAVETTTDGTAIKVTVALTATEAGNVVRGFVAAGTADGDTGATFLYNENNVIDVAGASNADVPELVSAAIVDADATTKQMTFKFSSQLQAPIVAAGFEAVYADGTTETSTAAAIKSGDATTVEVTFDRRNGLGPVDLRPCPPGCGNGLPERESQRR